MDNFTLIDFDSILDRSVLLKWCTKELGMDSEESGRLQTHKLRDRLKARQKDKISKKLDYIPIDYIDERNDEVDQITRPLDLEELMINFLNGLDEPLTIDISNIKTSDEVINIHKDMARINELCQMKRKILTAIPHNQKIYQTMVEQNVSSTILANVNNDIIQNSNLLQDIDVELLELEAKMQSGIATSIKHYNMMVQSYHHIGPNNPKRAFQEEVQMYEQAIDNIKNNIG